MLSFGIIFYKLYNKEIFVEVNFRINFDLAHIALSNKPLGGKAAGKSWSS